MKLEVIISLLFIFLFYSFLGWIFEVITIAIKNHKFVNRGITNGPLCPIYGFTAVTLVLASKGMESTIWLFIGSIIYGTLIEFITGKILEKLNKSKWWDYSDRKFNLDGYICLEYSLLWGLLGVLSIKIINPLIMNLFININLYISAPLIFILSIITILDILTSFITLRHLSKIKLGLFSDKIGNYILNAILKRIDKAYPTIKRKETKKKNKYVFAYGTSLPKLFLIFMIFGFIGNIVEVFFCRYSMGKWMNRSSLVFTPISIVWGFAIVLATILLHRYQNKSNTFLFIFGSIIGGAFEYFCSVFTEFFFGAIYWDYSKIPFNLNGRINLLFCFFWGFATVIYVKLIYPRITKAIEKIPKKVGNIVTTLIFIFFLSDVLITCSVLTRYQARQNGVVATNVVEKLCDKYADDAYIKKHWRTMKNVKDLKK